MLIGLLKFLGATILGYLILFCITASVVRIADIYIRIQENIEGIRREKKQREIQIKNNKHKKTKKWNEKLGVWEIINSDQQ